MFHSLDTWDKLLVQANEDKSPDKPVASLLSRDVRAFLGGGRFHQENQKG